MKSRLPLVLSTALALIVTGCYKTDATEATDIATETPANTEMTTSPIENNPFITESPLYLNYPPFDKVENSHFLPAFELGMQQHLAEIEAITNQSEAPTLDNTLIPMERSGQILDRVGRVFSALTSANTNDELEAIRSQMAPRLSAHKDHILLDHELFTRVQTLYEQRE